MSIVWLERDVVLALHDAVLSAHGGETGIADYMALDAVRGRSALGGRARTEDAATVGALILCAFISRRPFRSGNARTGAAAMETFLNLNGLELAALEEDVAVAVKAVVSGEWTSEDMAGWLNQSVKPRFAMAG